MNEPTLPELPSPNGGGLRYDHTGSLLPEPSYSADQMREYARAAVLAERERCAGIAEAEKVDAEATGDKSAAAILKPLGGETRVSN